MCASMMEHIMMYQTGNYGEREAIIMLTPKNISLRIENCADAIFSNQYKKLPLHFKDFNISSDYISRIFELLDVYYKKNLPEQAQAFVMKYSSLRGDSIQKIGVEKADAICKEFEELLGL